MMSVPDFVQALPVNGDGKIALFDADGTLWVDDVADDFTEHAIQAGLLPNVLKQPNLWAQYLKIYAQDPPEGCRFLLNLYKDASLHVIEAECEKWWASHAKRNWVEPVLASLNELHSRGYFIWVVTASPTILIKPIQKRLPVHKVIGIDFELKSTENGAIRTDLITGNYEGILCTFKGKAEKTLVMAKDQEIIFSAGNSAMDIPMIEIATQVRWAIYPNQEFTEEAKKRAWRILPRPKNFIEEKKFSLKKS